MQILYRGIHESRYFGIDSALKTKESAPLIKRPKWNISKFDNSTWGNSTINAVIEHQHGQAGLPTSGLSTTPLIERAKVYALGRESAGCGYIVSIDMFKCEQLGIEQYRVNALVHSPAAPEDEEVILVSRDGLFPAEIVVGVERICA